MTLSAALGGTQNRTRQFLELLVKHPEGVLDSQAGPALKLKKQSNITGVLTTLRNYLGKAECTFGQVIDRSKHFNGGGRDHRSLIRPEFYEEVKKAITH